MSVCDSGLVLQIGIVGHRKLPDADLSRLRSRVDAVMAEIGDVASERATKERATAMHLCCVSSLAAGADTIMTQSALRSGYGLCCQLPFPRDVYALDFPTGPDRDLFLDLLTRASRVEELHGHEGPEAYAAAARLLLDRSDLLIAIWDGCKERGIGGTGETIREARGRDIPVVGIDATPPHAVRILGHDPQAKLRMVIESVCAKARLRAQSPATADPTSVDPDGLPTLP